MALRQRGHASLDLKTGKVIGGAIAEQATFALESIGKVLREAGCNFENVVKCTCYRARIEDFGEFDGAYLKFLSGVRPARNTIQAGLGDGIKIEIDAIARIPSGNEKAIAA